ncbi:unnamed protein product [Clavelina lepadiformis]|uniref:Uncharacterized protein n=1 Tax=Clavelina lepadiformis TaxID=159417 RepID=A0ABP0H0J9_CLALP
MSWNRNIIFQNNLKYFLLFAALSIQGIQSITTITTNPSSSTCLTTGLTDLLVEAKFSKQNASSCVWTYYGPLEGSTFYNESCRSSITIGSDTVVCAEETIDGTEHISTNLTISGPLDSGNLDFTVLCFDTAFLPIDTPSISRSVKPCSLNSTLYAEVIASCTLPCEYNAIANLSCSNGYTGSNVTTTCGADCTFVDEAVCKKAEFTTSSTFEGSATASFTSQASSSPPTSTNATGTTTVAHTSNNSVVTNTEYTTFTTTKERTGGFTSQTSSFSPTSTNAMVFCSDDKILYPHVSNFTVTFPLTQAGYSNASLEKCSAHAANSGVPYGSKTCSLNGTWLSPKWLSSCDTNAQSYVNVTFNSTEERQEAADNLEIITSEPETLTSDNVTTSVQALENVVDTETLNQQTSSSIVATVGNLLGAPEEELQLSGQADSLIQILNTVGEKVELDSNEVYEEVSMSVAIAVLQPNQTEAKSGIGYQYSSLATPSELGFRSDQLSTFQTKPNGEASSYIVLPFQAFSQSPDNRVSFAAYPDDKIFRATTTTGAYSGNDFIGSEIILSARVVNVTEIRNLEDPVVVRLGLSWSWLDLENFKATCVFWDESENGFWSSEGLIQQNVTYETAECHFNHLTNFATLFSTTSVDIRALDVISIVGSSFSIFFLGLLVITFIIKREARRGKIKLCSAVLLINLASALLLLNISLIISEIPSVKGSGCEVIAGFIHFSLLASLAWMMVEGLYVYVVAFLTVNVRRVLAASLLWGWMMPALFVGVVAGVDGNSYSRDDAECWLRKDLVIYVVTIPAAVILFINLALYVAVMLMFVRRSNTESKEWIKDFHKNLGVSLALFVALGGTWLFGFAIPASESYNNDASIAFAYIFTIFNALQGCFLFILYVVRQFFTKSIVTRVLGKTFYPMSKHLSSSASVSSLNKKGNPLTSITSVASSISGT